MWIEEFHNKLGVTKTSLDLLQLWDQGLAKNFSTALYGFVMQVPCQTTERNPDWSNVTTTKELKVEAVI
jgi:hypothetical protein